MLALFRRFAVAWDVLRSRSEASTATLTPISELVRLPNGQMRRLFSGTPHCMWCHRADDDSVIMIAGPQPFICEECISVCHQQFSDFHKADSANAAASGPSAEVDA
jgi:hypothetical protein